MNLLPFNLEAALKGDPVCTRDGREVTEIYYLKTSTNVEKVLCIIEGNIKLFTEIGKFYDNNTESSSDLFMLPKTKTYWVNVYKHNDGIIYTTTYVSKEKADSEIEFQQSKRIKVFSFEVDDV